MKKTINTLVLCLGVYILSSQNGIFIEYALKSSKGPKGSIKVNYSEFGHISEFTMDIPQIPGGITNKVLYIKSVPEAVYVINEKSKTYSEQKKSSTTNESEKKYTVTKLGNEKVNGYNCVHAIVSSDRENYEVWNTKEIKEFAQYSEAMASNNRINTPTREKALKDAGCEGFMVKSIKKGNENEGSLEINLIKIEKKSFTASDFELPKGYTKSEQGVNYANPNIQTKTNSEIMNMTPEERAKYVEELKNKYKKN
ncbi:MAG: DUF4412 domain-containing protein [Bacteroidetes bacterium]|nr:DUF4412 domain-containing protein [Bacteroidota bacterium]